MSVTKLMRQRKRKTLRPISGSVANSTHEIFRTQTTVVHQQHLGINNIYASPSAISSSQSYIIERSTKSSDHLIPYPVTTTVPTVRRKSCNGSCDIFSQSIIPTEEHNEPDVDAAVKFYEIGIVRARSTDSTDSGHISPKVETSIDTTVVTSFKYLGISARPSLIKASSKIEPVSRFMDYHSPMHNISNKPQIAPLEPNKLQIILPTKLINLTSVNSKTAVSSRLSVIDSEDFPQNRILSNESSISYSAHQNASEMTSTTTADGISGKEFDSGLSSTTTIGLGVACILAFWLILGPLLLLLARRSLRRARGVKDRSTGPRRFQQGYGLAGTNAAVDLTSMNQICPPLARAKLYRTNLLDDSETERFQVLYSGASIEVLDNNGAMPRGCISVTESGYSHTSSAPPRSSSSRLVPSISSDYRISPSDSFHPARTSPRDSFHPARMSPSDSFHPARISPSDTFHLAPNIATFKQSLLPQEEATYVNDKDMLTGPGSSDDIGYETLAVNNHSTNLNNVHSFSSSPGLARNPGNLHYGIQKTENWSGISNANNGLRNILRVSPLQPKMNSSSVGFMTIASHYPLMTLGGGLSKRCKRFPTMGQTCLKNSYARSHNTGAGEVTYSNSSITGSTMTDSEVRNVSPGLYRLKNVNDVIANNFADLPQNLLSSDDLYSKASDVDKGTRGTVIQSLE